VLTHGKTKKNMRISVVSNSKFMLDEFEKYMNRLQKEGLKAVSLMHVESKIQDIQAAINYKYTAEEFEQVIAKQNETKLARGIIDSKTA